MSAEVFRLIAKPFLPLANGGSTFAPGRVSTPQVVARGAAEPDHSISPYLTRPLRSLAEVQAMRELRNA